MLINMSYKILFISSISWLVLNILNSMIAIVDLKTIKFGIDNDINLVFQYIFLLSLPIFLIIISSPFLIRFLNRKNDKLVPEDYLCATVITLGFFFSQLMTAVYTLSFALNSGMIIIMIGGFILTYVILYAFSVFIIVINTDDGEIENYNLKKLTKLPAITCLISFLFLALIHF